MDYIMIWQRKKQEIRVAGNREYKKTDRINSVQSSLKSHLFVGNPVYCL